MFSNAVKTNADSLNKTDKKLDDIMDGKLPTNLAKAIDCKINEVINKLDCKLVNLSADIHGIKDKLSANETKLETAIEAKLVENLNNSFDKIKSELQPTWANIVSQEVSSKFEQVTQDVNKVQQVLDDTKKKLMKRETGKFVHTIL